MFHLTIFTENHFACLGISARASFLDVMKQEGETEIDAVQTVDDDFVKKISLMEAQSFGFTQEFKDGFIAMIKESLGKKVLLANEWIMDANSDTSKYYMKVVGLLNEGVPLQEAANQIQSEYTK
ncbi:hypothetical protein [Bernardetia sp.]|uniref:hypothetical protein n=1 Tax=Bernardetia sp. TaxID=1937974 RepID=UPI0025C1A4A5|nr:hypothetical protein [Bernardetia sp.]